MGNQDEGCAFLLPQVLNQVKDLGLDGHIQRRRGLVGDEQLRIAGQGDGNHHPLFHAAGKLVGVLVDAVSGDAHRLQHLDGLLLGVGLIQPLVVPDALGDLFPHRHDRVQRGHGVLEHHRDLAAPDILELMLPKLHKILPFECNRPLRPFGGMVRKNLHNSLCNSRLSGAGLADKPQGLAVVQVEGYSVYRPDCLSV